MNSYYINNILRYLLIFFRFAFVAGIVILCCTLFYYVVKYAYPFIIAFMISFSINPLVNLLEKRARLPRGFATLIIILVIFATIIGLVTLLVMEMIDSMTYLTNVVPDHVRVLVHDIQGFFFTQIVPLWDRVTHLINTLDAAQQQAIQSNIQNIGQNAASILSEVGTNIVASLTGFIVSLPNILTVMIFVLLATFFICKDWYKIVTFFESKVADKVQKSARTIYRDLRKAFLGFIRAQLTLISITGVIVLIGLLILGVDHAVTIAIVSALVDLLPYLGTGTVFIPWIIYTFFTGNFYLTIGLAILYAVVVIQRQMMEPKILSSSIGIDPLPTLIALFVGFKLFGFLGLVIGPITLVVLITFAHANVFRDIWTFIIGKRSLPK